MDIIIGCLLFYIFISLITSSDFWVLLIMLGFIGGGFYIVCNLVGWLVAGHAIVMASG